MLGMVSYPRRPLSGHITCYLNRTYHVLPTQVKWKFATGGEKRYAGTHLHHLEPAAETMPDPWDFYLSSPTVWNGAVYFGSSDGNVYSLDATSGALKWKFHTGDVVHSSPAIADG